MTVPNAQAQIEATSQWYLQQGVLGATILLLLGLLIVAGFIIRHLYNDLQAANGKVENIGERGIAALNGASSDLEKSHELLLAIKGTLDTRTQALGDLSSQLALTAQEQRHGFGNITQMVGGILESVRELLAYARSRIGGAP